MELERKGRMGEEINDESKSRLDRIDAGLQKWRKDASSFRRNIANCLRDWSFARSPHKRSQPGRAGLMRLSPNLQRLSATPMRKWRHC